jgi:hypothetical protein
MRMICATEERKDVIQFPHPYLVYFSVMHIDLAACMHCKYISHRRICVNHGSNANFRSSSYSVKCHFSAFAVPVFLIRYN